MHGGGRLGMRRQRISVAVSATLALALMLIKASALC
jgi:hypothetical protein